jgi:hypothetical protein
MLDLLYVAVVIVFFALMLLLVRGCDRIIGPDRDALGGPEQVADEEVGPGEVEVSA